MLNELFALTHSRQGANIAVNSWHQSYSACPRRFTVRLVLNDAPDIVRIEEMKAEDAMTIRKYEESAGTSFPAFNLLPLYKARTAGLRRDTGYKAMHDALKAGRAMADPTSARQALREVIGKCDPLWKAGEIGRIERCLHDQSKDLLDIVGSPPPDCTSFAALVSRAKRLDVETLQRRLEDLVVEEMVNNPKRAMVWLDALIVSTADDLNKVKKASVILEVSDGNPYPANHSRVQEWINRRLLAIQVVSAIIPVGAGMDAFGSSLAGESGKLPKARLPVLGDVKLRAMSSESPCQKRYGFADECSFPIGGRMRQEMKDSLEWLGAPERRGRTWDDLSTASGYSTVLFVYPEILKDDPPELAGMFVRPVQQEEGNPDARAEGKFEAAAQRATAALQSIVKQHPGCALRVFVLAKPDGFRTKVLFSNRYEARALIARAEEWRNACGEMPRVALNIGTNKNPEWIHPLTPFPAEVVQCLGLAWLQQGSRAAKTHGLAAGDGIALLLEDRAGLAALALRLAVVNTTPLLLALGHADHRRDGKALSWTKETARYVRHASLLPAILALLLRKSGHEKGAYMQTAPFLVGRMLALADTLHMEYCRHVRKGQVPPQLMGNALMVQALASPMLGLSRLSERIPVYQAWARTVKGEGVGLAKWALGQMGKIANDLGDVALPDRADDGAKAQMLLGYLARPERADAQDAGQDGGASDCTPTENAGETKNERR
ncbi:MAG: hypothetical protein HYY93_02420 [Planctomycetes bacterium]|nr:hypothetical protein [Planctomycetota bacterium]